MKYLLFGFGSEIIGHDKQKERNITGHRWKQKRSSTMAANGANVQQCDLIETLRKQNAKLKQRLEDFQAHSGGLPFENEALLLHEVGALARKPPFAKTTRRKVLYANIDFPEGIDYNPCVERPITLLTEELKARTASYDFGSLHMDPSELMLHWFVMFSELDLFRKLNINPETLREFFRLVCNSYRDQVYHNFQHAMDVAQFAYALYMNSESCRQKLDATDMFCCLILGLAHDMGTFKMAP